MYNRSCCADTEQGTAGLLMEKIDGDYDNVKG